MVEKREMNVSEIIRKQLLSKALRLYFLLEKKDPEIIPLAFAKRFINIVKQNQKNTQGEVKPESASGESAWKVDSYELLQGRGEENKLKGFQINVETGTLIESTSTPIVFLRDDFEEDSREREVIDCLIEGLEEIIWEERYEETV